MALHLVKLVKKHLCLSVCFCTTPRDAHVDYLPKLSYRSVDDPNPVGYVTG